jgi:hypothetical protein
VSGTRCAEVLRGAIGRPPPKEKLLLVTDKVDGFFVQRFTEGGESVGVTQHDTMDEAMQYVYSEYDAISDWRLCPDGVDPLEYIRAPRRTRSAQRSGATDGSPAGVGDLGELRVGERDLASDGGQPDSG